MRLFIAIVAALSASAHAFADTYTITLDPAARSEPATGRVMLFFITERGRHWDTQGPIEGPFFEKPQPIASIAVTDFKPGDSIAIDGSAFAFPHSLDKLDGEIRVQAILDADQTQRSHLDGPGNVYSDDMWVKVSSSKDDAIKLTLNHPVKAPEPRRDTDTLKWIEFRSELLSQFYGRDIHHRAGVALPPAYNDPDHPRRQWPAIYIIPGYGDRDEEAEDYADMLGTRGIEDVAPIAVHVVLDPESPLGHHGFMDSPNHGPRGTALVRELIPHLESRFRLVARPEGRIVTGHSSGGWSSLWLQLNHADVFGACWSRAPDPVDFSAFQMTNLYEDSNLYRTARGDETPSFRAIVDRTLERKVVMTTRQECSMEYAIDPEGRSGQQWDAWEAMFSPRDEKTKLPRPLFNSLTGAIDKDVVQHWARYDIAKLMTSDWPRYGPVFRDKVRLACGTLDSFYLERAVERLKQKVESLRQQHGEPPEGGGPGYILMVEGADHGTVMHKTHNRWNDEMRAHLRAHGLHD